MQQLEGPKTKWTVRISALPVVLSAVKTDAAYATTGDIVKLTYTVSGDTRVGAVVTNAAGTPVRSLASGLGAAMGERSLTWDARGNGGTALADGVYTLAVTSTDDQGAVSSGSAQITVDNVAPDAALTSPAVIKPEQAAVVTVTDGASGIDQVRYAEDPDGAPDPDPFDYHSDPPPPGPATFTVKAPYGGWKLGRHVLRIYSRDKAGNSTHGRPRVHRQRERWQDHDWRERQDDRLLRRRFVVAHLRENQRPARLQATHAERAVLHHRQARRTARQRASKGARPGLRLLAHSKRLHMQKAGQEDPLESQGLIQLRRSGGPGSKVSKLWNFETLRRC